MQSLTLWVFLFLHPLVSFASFEVHLGSTVFHGVKLADSVAIKLADRSFSLSPISYGLRVKHIFVIDAKVYVAELLASDPIKFVHSAAGALSSLKEEKNIAMRLSFLRDVDESKIRSSFREGLVANKVDLSDVAIHALLEGIFATGPIREGDTVMIIGEQLAEGKEMITFENSRGKIISVPGNPGFIRQFFSIWFGESADSGIAELKTALVGEKK